MRWVFVDFDETICTNGGYPHFIPKKPKMGVKRAMRAIRNAGYKVIVYTARPSSDYRNIEEFLETHNIPFDGIRTGKELGVMYIDDKAFRHTNWSKDLDTILKLLDNGKKPV